MLWYHNVVGSVLTEGSGAACCFISSVEGSASGCAVLFCLDDVCMLWFARQFGSVNSVLFCSVHCFC